MTDRGLPIVDGAPACPFVAFADDRDERATSPDHRHRCYAELRPAPRALAHQEAYCLASAFPVCPTFQDWARREAARARSGSGAATPAPTPSSTKRPDAGRETSVTPAVSGDRSRAVGDPATGALKDDADVSTPGFLAGRDRPGGGLAGSSADRLAGTSAVSTGDAVDEPADSSGAGPDVGPVAAASAPPTAAASAPPTAPSFLDGAPAADATPARRNAGDWLDDEVERQDASWPEPRRDAGDERKSGTGIFGDRRPKVGDTRPRRDAGNSPGWEKKRQEAYPTRRTPIGMPTMTRVGIAALALGIAALGLFMAPGIIRNLGGSGSPSTQGPGASSSVAAGASPSASPTPSPTPEPSLYVVQPGDTLSAIAAEFGISLDQLIEANAELLEDPNDLQIGDELIIPSASSSESPGVSPSGSAPLP